MLVEDDKAAIIEIQHRLKELGYSNLIFASMGEEALQKAIGFRPDLILMDIFLKGEIDGVEAARQIEAKLKIPIVYITGHTDYDTLQRAKVTEPYGYVFKPFTKVELATVIETAMYRYQVEKELIEAKQWLSTTLQSISEAVITTNKAGLITFMNPAAEALTDWTQAASLGKNITEIFNIIKEETHAPSENSVVKILRKGMVSSFKDYNLLVTKNGVEKPIIHSASPIKNKEDEIIGVVLIFRDVSNEKATEQRQKLAHELGRRLTMLLDSQDLLLETVNSLKNTFGYYHTHIYLFYEVAKETSSGQAKKEGILVVGEGTGEAGATMKKQRHHIPLNAKRSLVARAARTHRAVVVNNVTQHRSHLPNPLLPETRSESAIPLLLGERLIGVLDVQHNKLKHFNADEIRMLQTVADQLSVALSNAQFFTENTRRSAIIENSSDLIALIDLNDFTIIDINPAGVRMAGYESLDEVIGLPITELCPSEKLNRFKQQLIQSTVKQNLWRGENFLRRVNGMLVPIDQTIFVIRNVQSEPTMLATIVRDITQRKETDQALQRYAERLKILRDIDRSILTAQSSEEVARVALKHLQKLLPCSHASVMLFNLKKMTTIMLAYIGHLNQQEVNNRIGQQYPLIDQAAIEELQKGQVLIVDDILALTPPPIKQFATTEGIRSTICVPLIAQNELIGSLNLGSDQTNNFGTEHIDIAREVADSLSIAIQQARLYQQIHAHAEELEQRVEERTAELQSFAYSVSHDLRAPLRAIQGFADALLEDYAQDLDLVGIDYAQRVVSAAQRMDTLIQDLLIYSRLSRDDIQLKPIALENILSDMLNELESYLQDAEITIRQPLPRVIGHHTTLLQILTNLTTNAVKFVAHGVRPQVKIWTEQRQDMIRLWVEDNGIGIALEHQERIFRIFERLHGIESYPGTGVGLAIVQKAVFRLNGRVGLESAPGEGSKFWIELLKG